MSRTEASGSSKGQPKPSATPKGPLDTVVVKSTRPSLYAVPDVNVGALGSKDPKDLPMSVESYSAELLQAQHARTLTDVLKNDPSVQNTSAGGVMDNISIRGFPIDWTNTMRRDGMPVAPYYDLALETVERIDVLKGPSGFLYGVNAPGGTVNYVIKRPTKDSFTDVTAEVRSYDGYYGALDTGGPIAGGKLGYRFNLAGDKVGNFWHAGDLRRTVGSGAIDWALSPRALVQLDFDYQSKHLAAQPIIGVQPDGALPPQFNPRTLLGQPWLQYRTSTFNLGGRFDFKFTDNWRFTTQVAHSYNNRDAYFPDIYSVAPNGDILTGHLLFSPDQSFRLLATNTFVSGTFSTGPLSHQVVTGISTRNFEARERGTLELPITAGNLFSPVYTQPPANLVFPAKSTVKNDQPSVFVSDLIDIGSQWSVMLGLRHVRYRNDTYPPTEPASHFAASFNIPSAGLVYKPLPSLSTYVSYAQGFEQGGVAPFKAVNREQILSPVKSRQYEAGVKADIGGKLTIEAALFRIEKSLQYLTAAKFFVQGGTERHTGVELAVNGRLTRDLSIVAGAAYLHTVQDNPGDTLTNGKRAANVPNFQANAFLDYRIAPVPGLSVDGGVYYVGPRPLDAQNTVSVPGYVRFDTGVRYVTRVAKRTTVLRAAVQNVTDTRYWAAANYGGVWPGTSRTVIASAQVEF